MNVDWLPLERAPGNVRAAKRPQVGGVVRDPMLELSTLRAFCPGVAFSEERAQSERLGSEQIGMTRSEREAASCGGQGSGLITGARSSDGEERPRGIVLRSARDRTLEGDGGLVEAPHVRERLAS